MAYQTGGIIIEGADQSGKSYTVNRLHDQLGFAVHHFSRPDENTDFSLEYIKPIVETGKPFIFDRSYVSEMVYGKVFRGKSGITEDIKEFTEWFLGRTNYILVYMENDPDKKWIDREEMYTEEGNTNVIKEYNRIYDSINLPKMRANSYDPEVIQKIMQLYKKHNPNHAS